MIEQEDGTSDKVKKNDTPKTDFYANIIDTFFGIICTQRDFYKIVIVFSGIISLTASYPNSYIGKLLPINSIEILTNIILSKNIYLILFPIFLLWNAFTLISVLMLNEGYKVQKIIELLFGTVAIYLESRFYIITIDKIIIFMFYFTFIKETFKFITRKFLLPTRYFGHYMKVK